MKLFLSVVFTFFLVGCSNSGSDDVKNSPCACIPYFGPQLNINLDSFIEESQGRLYEL